MFALYSPASRLRRHNLPQRVLIAGRFIGQRATITAFVISAGLEHHIRRNGLIAGGDSMLEVLTGCIVGIVAAWVVSVTWPLPEGTAAQAATR